MAEVNEVVALDLPVTEFLHRLCAQDGAGAGDRANFHEWDGGVLPCRASRTSSCRLPPSFKTHDAAGAVSGQRQPWFYTIYRSSIPE